MNIEFDPVKNKINLRKHGISLADVDAVFYDPCAITIEDRDHKEQRFVTMGMDSFGRLLVVCYAYRSETTIRLISARKAEPTNERLTKGDDMKESYDFSAGKRGAVIPSPGKTRITIHVDNAVLDAFREKAAAQGKGYQTLINEALRQAVESNAAPMTIEDLRRVIRQELDAA